MSEEIPKFKRPKKEGISISVDKENLDKLREFIKKHNGSAPLSVPFDSWLQDFVAKIPMIEEAIEKRRKKEEQAKKEREDGKKP